MALWTAFEAQAATGGYCAAPWEAHGVSIDTRTLQPGDLFVALTAARDGHDFVAQALEKGAAAALVERRPDGVPETAPLLIVPDVLQALIDLGRAARARCAAKVLAVTGSVGKTSTKEMLRTVLEFQGRTHASVASYNNHWGVPLTLARMPVDTQFAVIEIGMNHPGEIAPLAKLARPHQRPELTRARLDIHHRVEIERAGEDLRVRYRPDRNALAGDRTLIDPALTTDDPTVDRNAFGGPHPHDVARRQRRDRNLGLTAVRIEPPRRRGREPAEGFDRPGRPPHREVLERMTEREEKEQYRRFADLSHRGRAARGEQHQKIDVEHSTEQSLHGSHEHVGRDRKSTRLNSSHLKLSRMPSSA